MCIMCKLSCEEDALSQTVGLLNVKVWFFDSLVPDKPFADPRFSRQVETHFLVKNTNKYTLFFMYDFLSKYTEPDTMREVNVTSFILLRRSIYTTKPFINGNSREHDGSMSHVGRLHARQPAQRVQKHDLPSFDEEWHSVRKEQKAFDLLLKWQTL